MIQSIPENPDLSDVFKAYPHGAEELLIFHDIYLRKESPLTVAIRELIAAYVSGLNACSFCFGAHTIIAETFGVKESTITDLLKDIESADIEENLKPLFHFVKTLTLNPAKITPAQRQAVFDAGHCERSLHDTIVICALFNFMNRIIEGHGVISNEATKSAQKSRHQKNDIIDQDTFLTYGRKIGVVK